MSAPPVVPTVTAPEAPTLLRALGVRALAANIVNTIVGSGIFVLPALVAGILGPAAVIAYIVCAALVALFGLCFAEVGSRVHASGGAYAYAEAAFGQYVGFAVGLLLGCAEMVASAAVATIFVGSLSALLPGGGSVARAALLILLYAVMTVVNVRGVRAGARLMELLTASKLIPLALLVVAGLFVLHPDYLRWTGVPPLADVGRASLVLMFAFTGVEGPLTSSGEVKDPARTVPRAVLLSLSAVALLYAGLQIVSQGVLGPALATTTDAPLGAVAARVFGSPGRAVILVAAIVSALGYVSGDILASPRLLFAFARDGLLPARLGAIHPRFRTPHVAIITYAAISCAVALSGSFRVLAVLSAVGILLVDLACCLAVIELRRRDVRAEGVPFRIAGGPIVPLLACAVVIWLLTSARAVEFLAAAGVVVVSSLIYLFRRRRPVPAT
ncbi:MAG TPA: amino acid permease [Gemmatimonadaceae bacterium]|nr:amino acid permease [Gemmatimonadaceae bacterium]